MPDPVAASVVRSGPSLAVLRRDTLHAPTGPNWFERGELYAADGAVSALVEVGGAVLFHDAKASHVLDPRQ